MLVRPHTGTADSRAQIRAADTDQHRVRDQVALSFRSSVLFAALSAGEFGFVVAFLVCELFTYPATTLSSLAGCQSQLQLME